MTAVALPPPAGAGGSLLPSRLLVRTAPGAALRAVLRPAGSGGSGVPPRIPGAPDTALSPAGSGGTWLAALVIFALPPPPVQPQPAWQRDSEGWAVARERLAHVQALSQYGEMAVFALLWHPEDFLAGFTQRCYRCWQGSDDAPVSQGAELAIAAAYGQGNQYGCPVCYNTTFAMPQGTSLIPGLRALIVRPAVFTEFDRSRDRSAKGIFESAQVNVESTPDFIVRTSDYAFRADGSRFQLRIPRRTTVRTGFSYPWMASTAITYNLMSAALEDPLTIAYQIPPSASQLAVILGTYTRVPVSYDWAEVVNAPLIPEETPSPASSGAPQPPVTFPVPGLVL